MTIRINDRTADHMIDPIFLERWSPRAFTGEPVGRDVLMTMLEAGRWAPSSRNTQPWRFLYALRDTPSWEPFLDVLLPTNRIWASNASALVYLISRTTSPSRDAETELPSPTHSFDAGTASGYVALQAHTLGWFTHAMAGFDHHRLSATCNVPPGYKAEAAMAIGRLGDPASLPEGLRLRERPSGRRPLSELAFEGKFADVT